jgi:hypothetical protein
MRWGGILNLGPLHLFDMCLYRPAVENYQGLVEHSAVIIAQGAPPLVFPLHSSIYWTFISRLDRPDSVAKVVS